MATETLGQLAQQTVSQTTGETFDQALNNALSSEGTARENSPLNRLGRGETFADFSEATRQLLAESAAIQAGDRGLLESEAARRFISGDFGGTGTGTGGAGGATDSTPLPSPNGQNGVISGEIVGEGEGSQGLGNDLVNLISERFAGLETERLTEDQLLERENARIQEQVDAINALFDARVGSAEVAGRGRLGSTRALNAVSGNLFNPFGQARRAETESANQAIINEINRERAAQISNLYAAARGEATRAFESQEDRLVQTADLFINSMVDAYKLTADEANSLRNNALSIAALTGQLDGESTLDQQRLDLSLQQYLTDAAFQADQNARANRELELQVEQARQSGFQPQQFADGTVGYWDFSQPTPQFTTIGNFARITGGGGGSGGGGGGGLSGGGLLSDPLVRDALNAFESAGGNILNLDNQDLATITSVYASRTGNQSLADPSGLFTTQRSFLMNDNQSSEFPLDLSGATIPTN